MKSIYKIFKECNQFYAKTSLKKAELDCETRGEICKVEEFFIAAYYKAVAGQKKSAKAFNEFIIDNIKETTGVVFTDAEVSERLEKIRVAISGRIRRFKRKAYMNNWTHFVTITYDDKKYQSEDDFVKSLKKTLSNFSTRRKWRYMGAFERGSNGSERLHFHGLFNIPNAQMVGLVEEKENYNFKSHKWRNTFENSFFLEKFGINDFQPISEVELACGNSIDYCIKYATKEAKSFLYSRHLPTYMESDFVPECILMEFVQYGVRYLLDIEDEQIIADKKRYDDGILSESKYVFRC